MFYLITMHSTIPPPNHLGAFVDFKFIQNQYLMQLIPRPPFPTSHTSISLHSLRMILSRSSSDSRSMYCLFTFSTMTSLFFLSVGGMPSQNNLFSLPALAFSSFFFSLMYSSDRIRSYVLSASASASSREDITKSFSLTESSRSPPSIRRVYSFMAHSLAMPSTSILRASSASAFFLASLLAVSASRRASMRLSSSSLAVFFSDQEVSRGTGGLAMYSLYASRPFPTRTSSSMTCVNPASLTAWITLPSIFTSFISSTTSSPSSSRIANSPSK
mmetsp:Transcript_6151/g.13501  ORF Transcript_6151/g.13501 Transcript_6151/m.13501 type:complete len:273 (+) Transcript_6151:52-870(+)